MELEQLRAVVLQHLQEHTEHGYEPIDPKDIEVSALRGQGQSWGQVRVSFPMMQVRRNGVRSAWMAAKWQNQTMTVGTTDDLNWYQQDIEEIKKHLSELGYRVVDDGHERTEENSRHAAAAEDDKLTAPIWSLVLSALGLILVVGVAATWFTYTRSSSSPLSAVTRRSKEGEESKDDGLEFELDFPQATFDEWEVEFSDLQLGDVVGVGAEGRVYQGQFQGQTVAVKETLLVTSPRGTEGLNNKDEQQLMLQESELLRRLVHPSIITYYGTAFNRHSVYVVIEWAIGSLDYYLYHNKDQQHTMQMLAAPLDSLGSKLDTILQIAQGVHFLHTRRVIHRDLKTQNVLVTRVEPSSGNLVCKLTDFGLACMQNKRLKTSNVGTPAYLAPEVLSSEAACEYSESVDVYSFGILLIEILSKERPYAEQASNLDVVALAILILKGTRPRIHEAIPTALKDLASSCWRDTPKERPTMGQVLHRLQQFLQDSQKSRSGMSDMQYQNPMLGQLEWI